LFDPSSRPICRHRFEERQRLDVATVPPISTIATSARPPQHYECFDLVGDVGYHLHGTAEIVAATLLLITDS